MGKKGVRLVVTSWPAWLRAKKKAGPMPGWEANTLVLQFFFLPLPGQRIAIMQNHQHKACKHNDTCQPSQRISRPAFICIYRLAIDKQFPRPNPATIPAK